MFIFIKTVMLEWFVDTSIVKSALKGKLIEEEDVETRPEYVSASCLDENVCLRNIQKYFTRDSWKALLHLVEAVKQETVWFCGRCTSIIEDEEEDSIVCESCLKWFHFKCTGLKKAPKVSNWFCRRCHSL